MLVKAENFEEREFACHHCGVVKYKDYHVINLQAFRRYLNEKFKKNVPLRITSGYRCSEHNKAVGGVKNSRHAVGDATDVTTTAISVKELYEAAKEFGAFATVIHYTKSNFVHLDSRPGRLNHAWEWDK